MLSFHINSVPHAKRMYGYYNTHSATVTWKAVTTSFLRPALLEEFRDSTNHDQIEIQIQDHFIAVYIINVHRLR